MSSVVQLGNCLNYAVRNSRRRQMRAALRTCPTIFQVVVMVVLVVVVVVLVGVVVVACDGAAFNSKFVAIVTVFWRWLDKAS